MKELKSILRFYHAHAGGGQKMALATLISVEDSSYRRAGARMLILENGQWAGGISGGCLEGDALIQARKVMQNGQARVATYDTRDRDAHQIGVGLGCEGRIDLYIQPLTQALMAMLEQCTGIREKKLLVTPIAREGEPLPPFFSVEQAGVSERTELVERQGELTLFEWMEPNIRAVVIGDNYDIYPMLELCGTMGWDIVLAGRQRKLRREVVERVSALFPPDRLDAIPVDGYTAVICMSHNYATDLRALGHFLKRPAGYLGVLGPRKRFERMVGELGLDQKDANAPHSPMGLHIGALSPEEIALSVVAEVVKHFRGGDGRSLKEKQGPIHGTWR